MKAGGSQIFGFMLLLAAVALGATGGVHAQSTLTVTGTNFIPNTTLTALPAQLVATLSSNLNAATVNTSTVRLTRAGPDGVLGTADDVAISANAVSVNGNQITLDLTGVALPNGKYRFTLQSARGVSGADGSILDGAFNGTFPSGDGTYGDFNADFTIQVCTLWVTNMTPAPGAALNAAPAAITVTTNVAPDPASVNVNTVKLVRAGPDGTLGTADDVVITPNAVNVNGSTITMDLSGAALPPDTYQVSLLGSSLAPPSQSTDYSVGTEPIGIAVGDIDGDGKPDIVVANVQSMDISILLGDGAAHFSAAVSVPVGQYCWSVSLADVNHDGKLDIVVATGAYGNAVVLLNTTTAPGSPAFASPAVFPMGNNPSFVVCADVNGDGKPDLIIANQDSDNVGVRLNTTPDFATTPSFGSMYTFPVGVTSRALAVADTNGDGKPDVVTANYHSNSVSVLLNTTPALATTPSFSANTDFAVGQNPNHVELCDLNGDGRPDIIEPNWSSNNVGILFNTTAPQAATPSFAAPVYFNLGPVPSYVFAGDLDGDGRPDVTATDYNGAQVAIAPNATQPNASQPALSHPYFSTTGNRPSTIHIADLSGSGLTGMIVNSELDNKITVMTGFTRAVVRDALGNALDGEFPGRTGGFPSGDGIPGGDFTGTFNVLPARTLWVTNMAPAPNTVVAAVPSSITITTNIPADPATVNTDTVTLVRAGSDGVFGTADDVLITPAGVTAAGNQITIDLTGVTLPDDQYQVKLSSGQAAPVSGLVGHWTFSEGSGAVAHDSSGHGHDGTLINAPVWTTGITGGALALNGTNYVEVPYSAELNPGTFTISAWVKPGAFTSSPNGAHSIITSRDASPLRGYILYAMDNTASGDWEFWTGGGGSTWNTDPGNSVNAGAWTLVTGTYDGATMRFYENSVLINSQPATYVANSSRSLRIGAGATEQSPPTLYFEGLIAGVRVYNRALSGSEIAAILRNGIADLSGNPLDGKYPGAFPSGDGTFADFAANFRFHTAPIANSAVASVHFGAASPISLTGSDADNNPLTYALVAPPVHGTLSGTMPNVTYTAGIYAGMDSFSFKVNDGTADSTIATVVINVTDTAPVSLAGSAVVHSAAGTPVVLNATDADNDPLSYSIVSLPAHGTLTGTLPNLVYTAGGFTGLDSFTFKANDGVLDSNAATFTITVADNPPAATASASPTSVLESQQVLFTSTSSDPDGDALTVSWDFGDGSSSTDANPIHAYAAAGTYTAVVTVTDIGGLSAQAPVVIHVYPQANVPTARFVTSGLNGYVGQPMGFDATFSTDSDNHIVAYDWDFGDGSRHGSGQLISRVYTAPGTYTVTLTVTNGIGLSDSTSLTMVVLPASQTGLFPSTLKYSVSWNRAAANADRINLDATVNVGDLAVTPDMPLTLGIVGQVFSGTAGSRESGARHGPVVKWKVKPGKTGSPKGTVQISATISHASVGAAFAKAGAIGAISKTLNVPVLLSIGGESFQASISSQFRFGNSGMRAIGAGTGPK